MSDPWRHRCPNGHSNWVNYGSAYYCRSCEIRFEKLTDWKTKAKV